VADAAASGGASGSDEAVAAGIGVETLAVAVGAAVVTVGGAAGPPDEQADRIAADTKKAVPVDANLFNAFAPSAESSLTYQEAAGPILGPGKLRPNAVKTFLAQVLWAKWNYAFMS
jgi:hypothetical protein